jgi:ferredoxin
MAVDTGKLRVWVDRDACQSHGQCEFTVPDVFEIDDEGVLQYEPQPPAELADLVEQAAVRCPTQAITVHRS